MTSTLTLIVLGVVYLASVAVDRPVWYFTQEPASVLEAASYVGALSNTTQLAGAAAATSAILAWCVLGFGVRSPWLWGGLLTTLLTVNDMFLVDDHYLTGVGVPEPLTSATLAIGLLLFVLLFKGFVRQYGAVYVAVALAGFAGAEILDRVSQNLDATEDSLRFISQVSWAVFFTRAAIVELTAQCRSNSGAGRARRSVAPVVIVYGSAIGALLLVLTASRVLDRPVEFFTREPADILDAPAYVGSVSNLGALIWAIGATSAIVAWAILRPRCSWLLYGGVLTALLLLDDFFRLHESYYPSIGIPQKGANAAYFLLTVAYLIWFRRELRSRGGWLLLLALALLGASAAIDSASRDHDAIEDSVKLFGIVAWVTFFAIASYAELVRARGQLQDKSPDANLADLAGAADYEPRVASHND